MDNRWNCRKLGHSSDSGRESLKELGFLGVENAVGETVTLVVDSQDIHTRGDRRDVEDIEDC